MMYYLAGTSILISALLCTAASLFLKEKNARMNRIFAALSPLLLLAGLVIHGAHIAGTGVIDSPLYRITALWAGREGSFLLWTFMLAIIPAFRSLRGAPNPGSLIIAALFIAICATAENPFARAFTGMNQQLMNPFMAMHPPLLFAGYAAASLPFASLIDRHLFRSVSSAHPAAASLMLFAGIATGGLWAYGTGGWGGYWSWDPVENGSLVAWLFALVILVRGNSTRPVFSTLAATALFAATFLTGFITRSELFSDSSVHAFIGGSIPLHLLGACVAVLVGGTAMAVRARRGTGNEVLYQEDELTTVSGTYAAYTLSAFAIIIATATMIPAMMKIAGRSIIIAPSFYGGITVPFAAAALFLISLPLFGERKLSWRSNAVMIVAVVTAAIFSGIVLAESLRCALLVCFSSLLLFLLLKRGFAGGFRLPEGMMAAGLALLVSGAALSSFDERTERLLLPENLSVPVMDSLVGFTMRDAVPEITVNGRRRILHKERMHHPIITHGVYYDLVITPGGVTTAAEGGFYDAGKGSYLILTTAVKPYVSFMLLGAVLIIAGNAAALIGAFRTRHA
jgi:cytochrome c-type biogenesis protein CcmF